MTDPTAPRDRLRRVADVLMAPEAHPGEQRDAALEMHQLYLELAPLDDGLGSPEMVESLLSAGKAIAPVYAGRCIEDFARTRAFLRGLDAAIADARSARPERPVAVLYAGSGPFAALITPLLLRWTPDELTVLCVDVHEASISALRHVLHGLDLEASVIDIVEADAAAFAVPMAERFDILLTETMQQGLAKEPQVGIVLHLLPQLRDDVVMIPEAVRLGLAAIDMTVVPAGGDTGAPRPSKAIGNVFTLTAERVRDHFRGRGDLLRPLHTEMPRDRRDRESLMLTTEIDVYGDHGLGAFESGLTVPRSIGPDLGAGNLVSSVYVLGPEPHLEFTVR